jgi:hypothetical protein
MRQEFEKLLELLGEIYKKGHERELPKEVSEQFYNLHRALAYLKYDNSKIIDLNSGQIGLYLRKKGYLDSIHNIGIVRLEMLGKKQRKISSTDYELLESLDLEAITYLEKAAEHNPVTK